MSEPPDTVARVITRHQRIAVDSNVLIYVLDARGDEGRCAAQLLDAIEAGGGIALLATIGLVEILAGPARADDGARFEAAADELRSIRNLRAVPLSAEMAVDAAWIRGAATLSLPDSVHLATARAAGATAFVTNDRRIRSRPGLEVIYLSDLIAA